MGDAAFLIDFGDEIDEAINARVHLLAARLAGVPGARETVPAYSSLLVEFDPGEIEHRRVRQEIERALAEPAAAEAAPPRVVEIPTRYGGEFGPDLDFVAKHNNVSPEEAIRLHTSRPFRVYMLGFTPGFPYAGPVPPQIQAPRLETPRTFVPAGSVGVAGAQTGIYPRSSPGGWRLIGRTDIRLFDPSHDPPSLLQPGDYIQFVPVAGD